MSDQYIGYIKYEGKGVEDGIFDARKSAQALLGFDQAVRYFAAKEEPYLLDKDYELPVEIKKDSWDIFLPIIEDLMSPEGAIKVMAVTYLAKMASKAATDGLLETGISKDIQAIFRGSIIAMQWVIKIAKHIGSFSKSIQLKYNLEDDEVEVVNTNKQSIVIPRKYYDIYKECPETILNRLVANIEEDRVLKVGVFTENEVEEVSINESQKSIFYTAEIEENEILYPELQDGDRVELEGTITKVNEKANTLGFQYVSHILTIEPMSSKVTDYKSQLISQDNEHIFPAVKIKGVVDRKGSKGEFLKKPRIVFTSLIPRNESRDDILF